MTSPGHTYRHTDIIHCDTYIRPPKNIKWANKFKLLKVIMRQNMASHMYHSHATSTVELSTSYQSYVSFWRFTRKKALIRHEPDKTFISPTINSMNRIHNTAAHKYNKTLSIIKSLGALFFVRRSGWTSTVVIWIRVYTS